MENNKTITDLTISNITQKQGFNQLNKKNTCSYKASKSGIRLKNDINQHQTNGNDGPCAGKFVQFPGRIRRRNKNKSDIIAKD